MRIIAKLRPLVLISYLAYWNYFFKTVCPRYYTYLKSGRLAFFLNHILNPPETEMYK